MIKTILIGGLAVSLLTYFLSGSGSRLRSGGSSGPRVRYGPPYLPPGVPKGENDTTPMAHFRIILPSSNRNNSRVSPGAVLSLNETSSNSSGVFFLTPPGTTGVSFEERSTEVSPKAEGAGGNSSDSLTSSGVPEVEDSEAEEEVAGQGISPQGTTKSVISDSTTASYIQLRTESMRDKVVVSTKSSYEISSTEVSPVSVTFVPTTFRTFEERTSFPKPTERPSSSIQTESTREFQDESTSTSKTGLTFRRPESPGAKKDQRSETSTVKLSIETATEASVSYLPVSRSQPGIVTETVTESQDYTYYIVTSDENAGGESLNYLPPSRPALSLRLPINNEGGSPQSTSSGISSGYSSSSGRRPAPLYLPPRQ